MQIFIVDDSVAVRRALSSLVTGVPGVTVVGHAENAAEAIREITRLKPDLVVLDIQLKDSLGLDVLVSLKRDLPAVVVMVFTAFPSPHLRATYRKAGADYFFDKASEVDALTETVKKLAQYFPGGSRS